MKEGGGEEGGRKYGGGVAGCVGEVAALGGAQCLADDTGGWWEKE